jgi:hypothetical protein
MVHFGAESSYTCYNEYLNEPYQLKIVHLQTL